MTDYAGVVCGGERKQDSVKNDHAVVIQHVFNVVDAGAGNLQVSTPIQCRSLSLGWKLRKKRT